MIPVDAAERRGCEARLQLEYERRDGQSMLAARRHEGALGVRKPLYPKGADTCHTVVIHPPGGIADGGHRELGASLREGALLTTPGATKWYRAKAACERFSRGRPRLSTEIWRNEFGVTIKQTFPAEYRPPTR